MVTAILVPSCDNKVIGNASAAMYVTKNVINTFLENIL